MRIQIKYSTEFPYFFKIHKCSVGYRIIILKVLVVYIIHKKMKKKFSLFDSKEAKILWKKADDGIRRYALLGELYPNAPKEIKYIYISILELHEIKATEKLKQKVLKWLDNLELDKE